MERTSGRLRIGELAKRTGVSPPLLRAWEQRYSLLEPGRSPGGLRLFSRRDEERVRAMLAHMAGGLSAAEAARAVLSGDASTSRGSLAMTVEALPPSELAAEAWRLRDALGRLDGHLAQQALDRLLAMFALETVASEVVLPYLVDVGARWQRGEPTIAEEHLATQLLRGRLLALAYGLVSASGARVVLACPPGEHHDIALTIFAAALERRSCQVTLLGADTPVATALQAAELTGADGVVMAVTIPDHAAAVVKELKALAAALPLFLAGPSADERLVRKTGATRLVGDPVAAAGLFVELFARH